MRILQVIPTLMGGGAERLLLGLVRHLQQWGHTVAVVAQYASRGGPIEAELRSLGIELHFLGKRPGPDLRMVPRIAHVLASFQPDVFHSHSAHVLRYAIPAVLLSRRCPIVHTLHNLAQHESDPIGRALQYVAFRAGVATVAIGQAVAESMRRIYGIAPWRTIPNGIPFADFASPPDSSNAPLRAALSLPEGAPVFVAVGRLMAQKNHAALLSAFASEPLRAAAAHLLLAGDGPLRAALGAQARKLAIADRVHFLGRRSDVPALLHASDVFVLSSLWEGNPLSVMEAMAAGRPVVATSVGCVPELVFDGTGLLVAPGDVAALSTAMLRLARDPSLARRMGAAAARRAHEHFNISVTARKYEQLYRELT
jgi:glycosyltransferase involved in cell wall biosynthesis